MKYAAIFVVTLCLFGPFSMAGTGNGINADASADADADPGKGGDVPRDLLEELPCDITAGDRRFFTFAIENDLFGKGTDQNYTSGVRLTYFDLGADFPDFAHQIAGYIPTFSINRTSSVYYSIGQNLYTPDDISSRQQDPNDRPWAAFSYVSMAMSTLTASHIDDLEVTAGVVGPLALGEQTQKFIHRHISDSAMPKGWSNQLENEPGLMLSWQRRWPFFYEREAAGFLMAATPYAGVTAGNVYSYASGGWMFRLSPENGRWQDAPLRVRPAVPGTGFFTEPETTFDWYLFAGLEGRAVARNIFLDGNTFRDSHSVDKYPFVGDANAGLALTFGRTRLSYTLVYRTREFHGQDDGDLFGAISLSRSF